MSAAIQNSSESGSLVEGVNSEAVNEAALSKEKRILVAMRQTLAAVVREVTPSSQALQSPLSQATTEDIVMCFGLISAREREIEQTLHQGESQSRPRYPDQQPQADTQTVSLDQLKATLNKKAD